MSTVSHDEQPVGPTPDELATFLGKTRWFGGKGRPFTVTGVRRVGEVPGRVEDGPRVLLHLVELTYDSTDSAKEPAHEVYQVPLSFYAEPQTRLDHALIGVWEEPGVGRVHVYDALHDKEATACWLRTFGALDAEGGDGTWTDEATGLVFHRLPGHELDLEAQASLFSGEQSNSSVLFGEHAMMKLFRKVTPGENPDITVHDALTRAGSDHVADLYGWVDWRDPAGGDGAEVHQLAMLQQFLRTATDGWDLALNSVRNLFSEPELHADEVGGDFAGESTRLGEALREVHDALAEHLPTDAVGSAADLAAAMGARLDAALEAVPDLADHADRLRATYDRVAALGDIHVQRVHGDLHLGQTLRTSMGWKLVDFEGEPVKQLAERQLPDSRWRDVAGMLRSLDYAPHVVERLAAEEDPEGADRLAERAAEWAHRNQEHFLTAYAGGELTADQRLLLEAYVADKAVYETVYETRNRPGWVQIPLRAIARIGAS